MVSALAWKRGICAATSIVCAAMTTTATAAADQMTVLSIPSEDQQQSRTVVDVTLHPHQVIVIRDIPMEDRYGFVMLTSLEFWSSHSATPLFMALIPIPSKDCNPSESCLFGVGRLESTNFVDGSSVVNYCQNDGSGKILADQNLWKTLREGKNYVVPILTPHKINGMQFNPQLDGVLKAEDRGNFALVLANCGKNSVDNNDIHVQGTLEWNGNTLMADFADSELPADPEWSSTTTSSFLRTNPQLHANNFVQMKTVGDQNPIEDLQRVEEESSKAQQQQRGGAF